MGNLECPQHALGEQLMRRKAGNVLTIKADGASAWLVETGDDIEKGGLAGAVWSDQPGDRSGLDRERDVVNGLDATKILGQMFNGNHAAP